MIKISKESIQIWQGSGGSEKPDIEIITDEDGYKQINAYYNDRLMF